MHFGVADYAASMRARTVNIGGLNPDYPGRPVARRALPDDRGLPGLRAARRSTARSATSRIPTAIVPPRGAARRSASRASGRSIPSQIALANEVFTPPAGRGGPGAADPRGAGRGGAGGQGRRAARRPDDRRRERADGAGDRRDRREGEGQDENCVSSERSAVRHGLPLTAHR